MKKITLNKHQKAKTAAVLLALVSIVFCAPAAAAQKNILKNTAKTETYTIRSEAASYSIEDEIFKIPGRVTIESSTLRIEGADLIFDKKKQNGKITGKPAQLLYGKNTSASVTGTIKFDLKNETAQAEGDVSITHSTGTAQINMRADNISVDMKNGITSARGNATFIFRDPETEKKQQANSAKTDGATVFKSSPATLKADHISYNVKTGEADAGETVIAELPDAKLSAKRIKASVKDGTIEAESGFTFAAEGEITASADHAFVRYGEKTATLNGNVTATRGEDSIRSDSVQIDYNKGRRSITFTGGVDITIQVNATGAGDKTENISNGEQE